MRTYEEIKNDPQATEEEILLMLPEEEQIDHPNCPPRRWWQLLEIYPLKGCASSLYPLMVLEDPMSWEVLMATRGNDWINKYAGVMPDVEQRQFCADCITHVIPYWERKFPDDPTPQQTVELVDKWARSIPFKKEHQKRTEQLRSFRTDLSKRAADLYGQPYEHMPYACMFCLNVVWTSQGLRASRGNAAWVPSLEEKTEQGRILAQRKELAWQWSHLLTKYYRIPFGGQP